MEKLENSKTQKYTLAINGNKIIDAYFKKGPVKKNEKCLNFFNLPNIITDEFLSKFGNIMNKEFYKIDYDTEMSDDRHNVEEILCDLYFDLYKIASIDCKYSEIPEEAKKMLAGIRRDVIKAGLIKNPEIEVIEFDWNSKEQIKMIPAIIKKLVEAYVQIRELNRKIIKDKLFNILDDNRNNPYFI